MTALQTPVEADDVSSTVPSARGVPGPVWLPGVVLAAVLGLLRMRFRELWLDESLSVGATHHLGTTLRATGGTMGLYYALLTPWSWLGSSATWLRLPSLAFLVAAIAVTCSFVRRLATDRAARGTGILAALTPILLFAGAEARSYALVCLLTATAWYALDRSLDEPDPAAGSRPGRWPWVLSAALVALPLAHGLGIVQVGAIGLATLLARPGRAVLVRVVASSGLALAIVAVMFRAGVGEVGNWLNPLTASSALRFPFSVAHPLWPIGVVLVGLGAIGAAGDLPGSGRVAQDRFRRVALVLWGPGSLLALLALSVVRPSQLPRYGAAAALALAALTALGLDRIRRPPLRQAATLVLVAILALTLLGTTPARPWSATAEVVDQRQQAGDQLLFVRPDARLPFEAAWTERHPAEQPAVVGSAELGDFQRFDTVTDEDRLIDLVDRDQRVWVVDQEYQHQAAIGDLETDLAEAGFRPVHRWAFAGRVTVVLFVPR